MRTNRARSCSSAIVADAGIAHRRLHPADQLVDDVAHRALERHLPLDPLGHELQTGPGCPAGNSGRPSRAPSPRRCPCRDRICRRGPGTERFRPALPSVPASNDPTITVEAPAASALAMSPEVRMPPSAITGTPAFAAAAAASMIAVSCGTPTPATIRVVQIDPGPIPTLIASAPAPASALAASAVATLPATTWTALDSVLTRSTARATSTLWPCAVSMTMQSHARVDQRLATARSRCRRRWSRRRRAAALRRPWWRAARRPISRCP